MCLILDTNKYGDYLQENENMKPVIRWIEKGKRRLVYSETETMQRELIRGGMERLFITYRRNGKLKLIDKDEVNRVKNSLTNLKSNDPHIIALAIVAKVKLLVSEDKDLCEDFKNPNYITKGKVYQNESHKALLNKATCP